MQEITDRTGFTETDLSDLNRKEFDIAYNLVVEKGNSFKTIDDFINKVKEIYNAKPDDIKDDTLFGLLNNEDYKDQADKYKKSLSTLTSAM